jgi:hypothetical protein
MGERSGKEDYSDENGCYSRGTLNGVMRRVRTGRASGEFYRAGADGAISGG